MAKSYVDGKLCPVCGLVTLAKDFDGKCPRCGTKNSENEYNTAPDYNPISLRFK
jgi:rubrerythrin